MSNLAYKPREGNQVVAAESRFSGDPARANHNRELALRAARAGHPVYPVNPSRYKPAKGAPLNKHGRSEATTDEARIRDWWSLFPDAMPGMPTGIESGFIVLDIDPPGMPHFCGLLNTLECETPADLSACYSETPSGGVHLFFKLEPGTAPRTIAGDIAPGIDVRGLGGSIVLPGSIRRDGRRYQWKGGSRTFADAPYMPRDLLFLTTFNARERQLIAETPEVSELCHAPATDWARLLQDWRTDQAAKLAERSSAWADDGDGMKRQAAHDLEEAAKEYAELQDGRRTMLFRVACKVAKYVVNGIMPESQYRAAFIGAASSNGALRKHGLQWALKALQSALEKSQGDALPPLARVYRTEGR